MPESNSPSLPEHTPGFDMYMPFAEKLGVRVGYKRTGDVGLELGLREEHMNSWRVAVS